MESQNSAIAQSTVEPTKPTQSTVEPTKPATLSIYSPEVIQALTPIVLALLGALIGCLALIVPADKSTAALGLAGTAIAGAAGLAKSDGSSTSQRPAAEKTDSK